MKYSVIILNLTIMLGSVMLYGPSPFIFLKNVKGNSVKPKLSMDGWLYPLRSINDHDFKLLCEEERTAQRIKYNFQIVGTEHINLYFVSIVEDTVTIKIRKDREELTVMGRICENESETIGVMENSNYEGLLLFKILKITKRIHVSFIGVNVMRYLSYEEAGEAAVGLFKNFENEKDSHRRELEKLRICASLFRGLSSTLVQAYVDYFVRMELVKPVEHGKINYLRCEGSKNGTAKIAAFIKYELHFKKLYGYKHLK